MTSRSLQEHLASGDSMARLAAHAQRLLQFQRLLEAALPAALKPYARVANFRLGKLLIHADSGAVAAKIRQFGPRLASDLSSKERRRLLKSRFECKPETAILLPWLQWKDRISSWI
jgi:hypothetical protein